MRSTPIAQRPAAATEDYLAELRRDYELLGADPKHVDDVIAALRGALDIGPAKRANAGDVAAVEIMRTRED